MRPFLTGFVAGLTAGVLMAPKPGRETRTGLVAAYQEIRDRVIEEVSRVAEISRETYDQIVSSLVTAYTQTARVTAGQATAIKTELQGGFERIRQAHLELQRRQSQTQGPAA